MLDSCVVSWVRGFPKTRQLSDSGEGMCGAAGEGREDWIGHGWRGKEARI